MVKNRNAIRNILATVFCLLTTYFALSQGPQWWHTRGAVDPSLTPNDYAPITQGQLKWLALNAYYEMEAYFGAGSNVTAVVSAFPITTNYLPSASHGYPATIGQLKYVAQPFYDRLYQLNLINTFPANMPGYYPWGNSPTTNDFALANIGQAKYVFSFDSANDSDGDGLSDWREAGLGTNPYDPDSDDDGLSDGWEVAHGYDPLTGGNFPRITRSVLSGGGGARQVSSNFTLHATLAQPVAGFMTGSNYTLHVGYQQTVLILPQILNVGGAPARFNPSLGEVATLSYILDVASTGVTIEVSKGLVTNTLISAEYQGHGLRTLVWSGTNTDGSAATPGPWTFRVTASCTGQTTSAVAQVRVANNIPVIRAVSDEPELLCPGQGAARIYYTTADKNAAALNVGIVLEDLAGNLVAAVSYPDQPVGDHWQDWSGTDAPNFGYGGNPQPNGVYRYRLNASRPGRTANEKSGVIVLACGTVVTNVDNLVELRYQPAVSLSNQPDNFTVTIRKPTGFELRAATFALMAAPDLIRQSPIYIIEATPPVTFAPPALLTFKYPAALRGDIAGNLEIRRYDPNANVWVAVARQAVDWVNHQVIAEVTNIAFYALFATAAEAPTAPGVLPASVRLEPEVLKVNPGILTAFVSLPEGFAASGIVAATCDGAAAERMALSADGTEMVIKFRRRDIKAALAQQGQALDTHFVVEGTWQGPEGSIPFVGEDDIARIMN